MDEGVAQLFTLVDNGRKIVGTVGALQFDVIEHRLKNEYNATVRYESASLYKACWLSVEDQAKWKEFRVRKSRQLAQDKFGTYVYLAQSAWDLNSTQDLFPEITFHFTSELRQEE